VAATLGAVPSTALPHSWASPFKKTLLEIMD